MVSHKPLKNKIMQYERDYINSSIKWNLEEGDDIFKKIDVKSALLWLKEEIKNNSEDKNNISLKKFEIILNKAFKDAIKRSKKIKLEHKENIDFKDTELFKILCMPFEKQHKEIKDEYL